MTHRKIWLRAMTKISYNVLYALSSDRLKEVMPVEHHESRNDREHYTYLEAFGRTVCGIAPWLEHEKENEEEESLRLSFAQMTRNAMKNAVTPGAKDEMNFRYGQQPIVDAAFLAEGILRAPHELYDKLDDDTKANLILKMKETRLMKPAANNWLLFSAIIEVFLYYAGERDWDQMRIDYALRQLNQWYKGAGAYGDGPSFAFDYYNSYVINPMLFDIIKFVGDKNPDWAQMKAPIYDRASLYASFLEKVISPEGTYMVMGRSSAYRFGCFHALSQAVLENNLEKNQNPAAIRCALTEVIQKVMSYEDMFDENGWLTIGICGHQQRAGETYISTGSLYLCSTVFLPLGLKEDHPFWTNPDAPWMQKRVWGGDDIGEMGH